MTLEEIAKHYQNHTTISFPGLGIGEIELKKFLIEWGENFNIAWYGVIITLGIVIAFSYAVFRGKYEKIKFDDIIDVALWTVILGVVGARAYYVIFDIEEFIARSPDILTFIKNAVSIHEGGLAIYGGIIFGILGIIIGSLIKKMNTIKLMDMAGPGVMIAQALGRWGNFVNGEAYGVEISKGHPLYFMRMGLTSYNTYTDKSLKTYGTFNTAEVHPTFLYESLWNILGFVIINIFYKKKKFNGQIACMYLAWYGFGRFFIEGLRTDSLYMGGGIRTSQLVGAICFFVFGGLLIAGLIYSRKFNDPNAKLSKFDMLIKPSMDKNPIFFEKKGKVLADGETTESENKEENKDGTDN